MNMYNLNAQKFGIQHFSVFTLFWCLLRTLFVHLRTIFVHFEAAAAAAYQPPRPQPKFSRSNIVTRHWLKILGWVQICWLGVAT